MRQPAYPLSPTQGRALLITALCLTLTALASAAPAPQALLTLDTGTTEVMLSGTTQAGRWTMDEAILGGEREEGPTADGWVIAWDGVDNDPAAFDTSGLGGIDLTAKGRGDHLLVTWRTPLAGAGYLDVEVWSHQSRRSSVRLPLNGAASESAGAPGSPADGRLAVPFDTLIGTADLRAVGALRVIVDTEGNNLTSPQLAALAVGLRSPMPPSSTAAPLGPAPVAASLILQDGDTPAGGGGNAVTSLGATFVNGLGEVGFTGNVDNGGSSDGFVFSGNAIVQLNSTTMGVTLSGGESTMGIDDTGGFFYSPSIDGDDGVWSQNGQVAVENTQAPGFPGGTNSTFHSRPTMTPDGAAHWISGFNESGGTSTEGRMLFTSSDATAGSTAVVLRSDDMVGGLPIDRPSGIDFDYDFSDNSSHLIQVLLLDTGSTTDDGIVYVDGAVIATEMTASGDGDNWDNFDAVVINDSGDFLFSGDTDGATASDEFIAYNGTIALREGDVVDGVVLGTSVQFLSLNNRRQALHAWSGEVLFVACDASDLAGTSRRLLATGDLLDFDGDGVGDATLTDFNTSGVVGPTSALAADGSVFLEVDVDFGSGDVEAVISLRGPACDLVINEIDYDQPVADDEEFIEIYNGTGSSVNLDSYSLELVDGNGGGASVYATIDLPNVDLADGDFYVVCGDAGLVPDCDLDATPNTDLIEDGAPDAVALLNGATIVDTVSYEGDTGGPYTETSGLGLEDDGSLDFFSLSRIVDGSDSNRNNVDFAGRCNSPGRANFSTTSSCVMVPVELMSFSIE